MVDNFSSDLSTWVFLIKHTLGSLLIQQFSLLYGNWKMDNKVVHHRGRRFKRASDKSDIASSALPPPTPPSRKSRDLIDASFSYKVCNGMQWYVSWSWSYLYPHSLCLGSQKPLKRPFLSGGKIEREGSGTLATFLCTLRMSNS